MQEVCKNVAFDGQSFYCMRCGRAGFRSEAAARGHLSQCKGRLVSQGIHPAALAGGTPAPAPAGGRYGGAGVVGAGGGGGSTTYFGGTSAAISEDSVPYPDYVGQQLMVHSSQIAELRNEYNHMLVARNQSVVGQDWFSRYKGLIVIGAIIVFAMILSEQSNKCLAGTSPTLGKSAPDIGHKALSKLVDVGISKGVSSLFK